MLGRRDAQQQASQQPPQHGSLPGLPTLLMILGDQAKIEGTFDIAHSIQIECEVGGELKVGGKLVIGEKGVVRAGVQTVDAVIYGQYEGNMVATGDVEIMATGRVSGNIETNSLVIAKGGFFNGNVTRIQKTEGERVPRPVLLMEEKRLGQQR